MKDALIYLIIERLGAKALSYAEYAEFSYELILATFTQLEQLKSL